MSKVADADALIIDLRENGGGDPDTVAFVASFLFDSAPVHLNDFFGAANAAALHVLNASFAIAVPDGRGINAVTKTKWEGVGVKPDIAVPADAALQEARRRASRDILSARSSTR